MNPETFSLGRINWDLFGTLTFKGAEKSTTIQRRMFWQLVRSTAKSLGVHFKTILWVLRHEAGDKTGRQHFHFLIAFQDSRFANTSTCFLMKNQWEKLGGGMARVHVFSGSSNGLAYVTKNLTPGHVYESGKFNQGCDLTLSKSVVKRMLRNLTKDKQAFDTGKSENSNYCSAEA